MKKQTKADKAFIEKIKTICISGKVIENDFEALQEHMPTCPDCGNQLKLVGAAIVEVSRVKKKAQEEKSFSA